MKPNGRKRASLCLENVQAKLERIAPIPVLLIKAISRQKDVRGVRSALARRDITVKEERQKTNNQSTGTACFILLLCFVYRQARIIFLIDHFAKKTFTWKTFSFFSDAESNNVWQDGGYLRDCLVGPRVRLFGRTGAI